MKTILFVMALSFASITSFAETAKVQVNGMVCAFCAQGIQKKFNEHPAVEKCSVDLDKKIVEVKVKKDKKITDAEIEKIIKAAGYAAVKVERFQ